MRPIKPLIYAVAILSALHTASARAAEADVLKQIPADAQFVLVIPNIAQLSDKATKIAEALNLPQPELQQPLDQLKGMLGIDKGLNESGGLALIAPNLSLGQNEAIAILPVTDYKAFVANFGVANAGEGITSFEFQGQPAFIKKSGNYAVFSNQQHLVESYKAPTQGGLSARVGALGGKVLGRGDMFVFLDLSQIGPMIQPMVQMQMEQMKAATQQQPGGAAGAGMIDLVSNVLQALLRDGQSVVVGFDASMEGLGLSFAAQFKPGTSLATTFANAPTAELGFNRLLGKPYFVAMSMNTRTLPLDQWTQAVHQCAAAGVPDGQDGPVVVRLAQARGR